MKTIGMLTAILLLLLSNSIQAGENASNPLAAVSNTDIRVKTFDLGEADLNEAFIDGATMLTPKLKLKYELHWWDTDISGDDENDWERALLKLIYFPKEGKLKKSEKPYRLAVGLDWVCGSGRSGKRDWNGFGPGGTVYWRGDPG